MKHTETIVKLIFIIIGITGMLFYLYSGLIINSELRRCDKYWRVQYEDVIDQFNDFAKQEYLKENPIINYSDILNNYTVKYNVTKTT